MACYFAMSAGACEKMEAAQKPTVDDGFWERLKRWLGMGKSVAILGEQSVGKTTLHTYITTTKLVTEYSPTKGTEPAKAATYRAGEMRVRIQKAADVTGLAPATDQWRPLIESADVLIYLVHAGDLLGENEHRRRRCADRVARDAANIRSWYGEHPKVRHAFVVGTFSDLIPGYQGAPGADRVLIDQRFANEEVVRKLKQHLAHDGCRTVPVFLASMATEAGASALVRDIFKAVPL